MVARTGIRVVLVLAAVACPGLGRAAIPPSGGPSTAGFATELAAVIAGASEVNARSIREDREYMGAILRRGDSYHYSVVPGVAGGDRIRVRLAVPEGFTVVAFWHTHGAARPDRRYFSPTDRALVQTSGLALYMADYSGALRRLRPGAPRLSPHSARQIGLGGCRDCATGELLRTAAGDQIYIPTRVG